MKRWCSIKYTNIYGAILCFGLVLASLYFEHVVGLEPCPLCILQRFTVMLLTASFAIGILFDRLSAQRIHAVWIALVSAIGIGLAGRQVWLQHLPPDQVPSCGASLEFLLGKYPLIHTLATIIRGGSDCADASWKFLHLTMAGWLVIIFCFLFVVAIVNAWRAAPTKKSSSNSAAS